MPCPPVSMVFWAAAHTVVLSSARAAAGPVAKNAEPTTPPITVATANTNRRIGASSGGPAPPASLSRGYSRGPLTFSKPGCSAAGLGEDDGQVGQLRLGVLG